MLAFLTLILWSIPMPEREVNSPVNTRYTGSKVGSIGSKPLSPGARSDPGRVEGPKFDAVPTSQLRTTRAAHQEEPPIPPSSTTVTVGPEE
jgi:hypothetical protein